MPMPMFRAVLFDADGTLIDSFAAITASVNHVRDHNGLPPLSEGAVKKLVGHGLPHLIADVIPGGDHKANVALYYDHHPTVMFDQTQLLPGAAAAIVALHEAGIKLAVCSNKPVSITRKLLEALQIDRYFDATLGPEDSGIPKPNPAMVNLALKILGVNSSEALYVGDMAIDVETARNAGLAVWVLPTGSGDRESLVRAKPDRILESLTELAPAILGGR
jgi:HAD superfamily hydrolase (TIGR01509 family)